MPEAQIRSCCHDAFRTRQLEQHNALQAIACCAKIEFAPATHSPTALCCTEKQCNERVCMYVCMYVGIRYVRMPGRRYVCAYVCVRLPMYVCACVRMDLCMHGPMQLYASHTHTRTERSTCACVYPHVHYVHMRVYVCMYVYTPVSRIYIYMLFYSYMYTYSDTRVNIYVCFHTHRQAEILGSSRFLRHPKPGVDTVRAR